MLGFGIANDGGSSLCAPKALLVGSCDSWTTAALSGVAPECGWGIGTPEMR